MIDGVMGFSIFSLLRMGCFFITSWEVSRMTFAKDADKFKVMRVMRFLLVFFFFLFLKKREKKTEMGEGEKGRKKNKIN